MSNRDQEKNSIACNLLNKHQRDQRCEFDPEPHEYRIDGISYLSVSTIVSTFFPVFNPDEAINKMKNGRSWNPANRYWGMQDFEIKQMWEEKGIIASEKGTFLHEQIERFYLNEPHEKPEEFKLFREFSDDHDFLEAYRTEWRIFDENHKVAGTIDFVAKNGAEFEMYDWKRSHKVVDKVSGKAITNNPWERGSGQLNDMDDTSYNQYSLQQSIYRYILEQNYEVSISKMYLVVLHPDYNQYYKVEVPYLKDKVEYILSTL